MNTTTKLSAIILTIIILTAAAAGYLAYTGAFNPAPPTATPTPNPTLSSSPTTNPTDSTTTNPATKPTANPTTNSPTATPSPVELRVFIASSLIHVAENMTAEYEKTHNVHIILNSDSSSALYTQITNGAPCDVYLSADQKWTKNLLNGGYLLNDNYVNFTTNSLEMIIAEGNPKGITSLYDLTKPGVNVVLADPTIPSGSYTNTTCLKIDRSWGNPSSPAYIANGSYVNFNQTLHANVHNYPLTVEQVVGAVSLNVGTADAGIVFTSDAMWGYMTHAEVSFIPIPSDVNTRGTYGIGVIKTASHPIEALEFMAFWNEQQGQALLTQFGFNS